jgi:L-iditol 2-dehydrogenase/threonine 3-dehydrogenase
MRQAIMTSPGVIEYREVPEPADLGPDEILLRIQRIGICGSDIHVYHGKHPFTPYPVIQGHEYSGLVKAVGSGVTKVAPGTKATARPQIVCGECGPCKRGDYHVCQHLKVQGFQAPGCAQDLFVVSEDRIIPFPDHMSYEQGALIEPASVGAHSTKRATDLVDKNVVVAGAGTIGNMIAQFVKARGARKVLITDLYDYRLNMAKSCGIDETANMTVETMEEAVSRVFGEAGFQVGFEAAGVQASIDGLISHVEKGGEIIIAGVFEEHPTINMGFVGEHELKLIGTLMYKHEDYLEAVEFISHSKICTDPLVTRHFSFEQYHDAYAYLDEVGPETMKVMIDL